MSCTVPRDAAKSCPNIGEKPVFVNTYGTLRNHMRILGIETSCDDTAVGIVHYQRRRFTIEAQVTASQALVHKKYGGVVPEVAAREHAVTIIPTLKAALKKAAASWVDIDAIAVTGGPGLNTALLVGVETARTLSYSLKKPLIRVNHIEGHIAANWVTKESITFPAIALVVSGGHTELLHIKHIGRYSLIGRTLDDAVGEAFDKVAKMLRLPYPGGPSIAKVALTGNKRAFRFPVSLMQKGNLDFSYAGLKTAVLYELRAHKKLDTKLRCDVAASFQQAAIAQLVKKTERALEKTGARSLLLAGGVAANTVLRNELKIVMQKKFPTTKYFQPPIALCMDNGVMIAMAAALRLDKQKKLAFTPWKLLRADPNWELV